MPRFVILYHQTPADDERDSHWDLMLESDAVLRTWALTEEPGNGKTVSAQALADHRRAYLDYEGPLSENRGTVSRWDAGTYVLLEESDTQLVVQLQGGRVQGRVTLDRSEDHYWTVRFGGA